MRILSCLALCWGPTACSAATPSAEPAVAAAETTTAEAVDADTIDYDDARQRLESRRIELAAAYAGATTAQDQAAVLNDARVAVNEAIQTEFFPAWAGTNWEFYGTTTTPREGDIACGHYVSVVLDHAGFEVQRLKLGQQASENIIKTFSQRKDIRRFSNKSASDVTRSVREMGAGTYILGLDYHAAFLTSDGERVLMCHSSYLGTAKVLCEDAETSPAMVSNYRVVGKLFDDAMMRRWLRGQAFATVGSSGR